MFSLSKNTGRLGSGQVAECTETIPFCFLKEEGTWQKKTSPGEGMGRLSLGVWKVLEAELDVFVPKLEGLVH